MENLGSRLEERLSEKVRINDKAWTLYLQSDPNSTTGHAYISSVVTRFKFELGAFFATPVALAALLFISVALHRFSPIATVALFAVGIVLMVVLHKDAKDSVSLLDNTRQRLFAERVQAEAPDRAI